MLLLGHRGARNYAPENTIPAFELALQHGCDGIEFDVRRTSDGRSAVCHDRYFGGLEVCSNTFASLAAAESSLPTLEEVITRFCTRAFLYIVLKVAGLEQITLDALGRNPPQRGYVVASFLAEVISTMHALDASVPLGLICGRTHEFAVWPELPVSYVMPRYTLVTRDMVDEFHAADRRVLVWTVNSERDIREMAKLGVDGMLSDDTILLRRTLPRSMFQQQA